MGGLETALLIGAATGAGTSALTGGDPLKGALFGAIGGGVTSGLGSALGGAQAGQAMGTAGSTAANVGTNIGTATTGSYAGANLGTTAAGSLDDLIASGMSRQAAEQSMLNAQSGLTSGPITQTGANLAPQTGFMDIFKPTPGGPEFGQRLGNYIVQNPGQAAMSGSSLANTLFNQPNFNPPSDDYDGPLKRFRFNPASYIPTYAEGGITDIDLGSTATLSATPVTMMARGGGIADLGSYSDGGRLLKGPGDGMSDSIPARIGRRQPARLADGEFVVPADVVSHLGNGSTDAGAKQLYAMMDKVRRARTGNKKQGREINPRKFVPA
jgi:hypothetical protein